MNKQTMTMSAVSVLIASMALTGCGRRVDADAARTADNTAVVQGQPTAADSVANGTRDAVQATKEVAGDAKDATRSAANEAGNAVSDAVITTTVNAELAKDAKLSALRIDVDTAGGRVALKGAAPDAASKERATQLASNVKGVVSVDNQLKVESKG